MLSFQTRHGKHLCFAYRYTISILRQEDWKWCSSNTNSQDYKLERLWGLRVKSVHYSSRGLGFSSLMLAVITAWDFGSRGSCLNGLLVLWEHYIHSCCTYPYMDTYTFTSFIINCSKEILGLIIIDISISKMTLTFLTFLNFNDYQRELKYTVEQLYFLSLLILGK